MKLSARNQIVGTVIGITPGAVNGSVKVDIGGGNLITANITEEAIADLKLIDEMTRFFRCVLLRGICPKNAVKNLLQRTRCVYFRSGSGNSSSTGAYSCNKRDPGSGCAAIGGLDRGQAVLGQSTSRTAVSPGDWPVALTALDASVELLGRAVRGPSRPPSCIGCRARRRTCGCRTRSSDRPCGHRPTNSPTAPR